MSKEIYEYDAVANDNNFSPSDGGMPEFQARSSLNDAARERMAALRRHYNDSEWIVVRTQGPAAADVGAFNRLTANTFNIQLAGVDLSSYFADGRVIKVVDGLGVGVDLVTQVSGASTFSDPFTNVTTKPTDTIDAAASDALVHSNSVMRALALLDSQAAFFIPEANTDVGVQAAIDAADAAGGGTVLLIHSQYQVSSTINLASSFNIKLEAASHHCEFRQSDGSALDEMFLVAMTGGDVSFDGVQINMRLTTAGGGAGVGINLVASGVPIFRNCLFVNSTIALSINTSALTNVLITGCGFYGFTDIGINASGPTLLHEGEISECYFSGGLMASLSPAAVKASGKWSISGCVFRDIDVTIGEAKCVWLWNHTADGNGGAFSSVVGNYMTGASGQRIGVEVGASHCVVSGNTIRLVGTGGTGVFVRSFQAGNPTVGGNISDNEIISDYGVRATSLTSKLSIYGNSIHSNLKGVVSDGDAAAIVSNSIHGGQTGIEVSSSADANKVSENFLSTQTGMGILLSGSASSSVVSNNSINGAAATAISVPTSVVGARVSDNDVDGSIATIVDMKSESSVQTRNGGRGRTFFSPSVFISGTPTVGTQISGDLPDGGGVGTYRLAWKGNRTTGSGAPGALISFSVGPLGTVADPVAMTITLNHISVGIDEFPYGVFFQVSSVLDTKWSYVIPASVGINLEFILTKE